jgi:hypothetical protein
LSGTKDDRRPCPLDVAMMLLGFVGIGFMGYRKKAVLRFA